MKEAETKKWQMEEAIQGFCSGSIPYGPYYEHVLGYYGESTKDPNKVMFITYEDLKADPKTHVKRMAEFLGCPFGGGHLNDGRNSDGDGKVEEIVRRCSFGVLSENEVNKSKDTPFWSRVPYNAFFRRGEVGDHAKYLSPDAIARIDAVTKRKFYESGLAYGI